MKLIKRLSMFLSFTLLTNPIYGINREQYITGYMIENYNGEVPTMRGIFRDTSNPYVELAYEKGLIKGDGSFKFYPQTPMSNEEIERLNSRIGYSYEVDGSSINSKPSNIKSYKDKEFDLLEVTGDVEFENCKIKTLKINKGSASFDDKSYVNKVYATDITALQKINSDYIETDSGVITGKVTEILLTKDDANIDDLSYKNVTLGEGKYKFKYKLETVTTKETSSIEARFIDTLIIENDKKDLLVDSEVGTIEDDGNVDVELNYDVRTYNSYGKNKITANSKIVSFKGKGDVTYKDAKPEQKPDDKPVIDKPINWDNISIYDKTLDAENNTIQKLLTSNATIKNAKVILANILDDTNLENTTIQDAKIYGGDVLGINSSIQNATITGSTSYISVPINNLIISTSPSAITINSTVNNITTNGGNIIITGIMPKLFILKPTIINNKLYNIGNY